MSSTATFRLIMPAVGLALAVGIGCASQRFEPNTSSDRQLQAAIKERDAAAAQVAKAIGRYCSLQTDSLESRQRCVIGKEVDVAFIAPVEADHRPNQPEMASGDRLMQCEAEGRSTLCRRRPPAYVELRDRH